MIPVMIVPILTRPDLLDRMLDSVDYPVHTLVVIDNGHCLPGNFAHRDWASSAYLLRMPSNLGVATSWNLGIKATPHAPWWLIANFDLTWPRNSLAQFDTEDAPEMRCLLTLAWAALHSRHRRPARPLLEEDAPEGRPPGMEGRRSGGHAKQVCELDGALGPLGLAPKVCEEFVLHTLFRRRPWRPSVPFDYSSTPDY